MAPGHSLNDDACTGRHIRHHDGMHARLPCLLLLLSASTMAAEPPPDNNVRVYRCVASNGAVALQSTPCADSQRQQVLDMLRPQDPPPRPVAPPPVTPSATINDREIRIVTVQPPRPMYECVGPDGERYVSETGEGNPRWVPLWTGGYGGYRRPPPHGHGGSVSGNVKIGSGEVSFHSGGQPPMHDRPSRPYPGPAMADGTWVRDTCHPLPQQEVCARLRDRRWELIRRYHSALQSERQELTREQRGIEARLGQDCGGY